MEWWVADLNDLSGLALYTKAEPGIFKKVIPHTIRIVKWTTHGKSFPLFARSVQHNETIEGIEQCEIQMLRD